jgi:hypothetical protein
MDGDRGDRYGYDTLGQVTDVKYDALDPQTGTPTDWSRRVQYQWDPVGNRKKVTEDGVATTYAANLVNQYTTVGGAALSYDGNGNLATAPAATGLGDGALQSDPRGRATNLNMVRFRRLPIAAGSRAGASLYWRD